MLQKVTAMPYTCAVVSVLFVKSAFARWLPGGMPSSSLIREAHGYPANFVRIPETQGRSEMMTLGGVWLAGCACTAKGPAAVWAAGHWQDAHRQGYCCKHQVLQNLSSRANLNFQPATCMCQLIIACQRSRPTTNQQVAKADEAVAVTPCML